MKKNRINGLFYLILICLITLNLNIYSYGKTKNNPSSMKKYYNDISLKDDFEDDSIIVTFTHEYSISIYGKYNAVYISHIIPKNKIFDIIDYTYISDEFRKYQINKTNFNLIVCIKLVDNSKQNVIEMIEKLNNSNIVFCAEPNYICKTVNDGVNFCEQFYSSYFEEYNALEKIGADKAQQRITRGSLDVKIGIMEEGVFNHPDFGDRLSNDIYNPPPSSNLAHGTFVTGLAAGQFTGVAPNVTIYQFDWNYFIENLTIAEILNIKIINASFVRLNNDGSIRGPEISYYTAIKNYPGLLIEYSNAWEQAI